VPMTRDERLDDLLDRQEITDCLRRIARGMDRHDAELALSGFHQGARDDHALFIGAAGDMLAWAEAFHDTSFATHQHFLAPTMIEIDGDEAHCETYVMVVGAAKEGGTLIMGGGRYVDRLERRDGRWGVVDRVTTVEWWSDPAVLESVAELVHPFSQSREDISYRRPVRADRPDRSISEA
jgi:SnoaL-like domain